MSEQADVMTALTGQGATPPAQEQQQTTQAAQDTKTPPQWTDKIEDEAIKGWAQNKGFHAKDPAEVAKSYYHLEKLFGADKAGRTVEVPSDPDNIEEWGKLYNKLGRPENADGYTFGKEEGNNPELVKWAKETFHEIGMSDKAAATLMAKYGDLVAGDNARVKAAQEQKFATDIANLKKEWGAAYDVNFQKVDVAAQQLGIDNEAILALKHTLGIERTAKMLLGLADKVGEDTFVNGASDGVMTPAQAIAKRNEMLADKQFMEAWLNKNHAGHANAIEKMAKIARLINGQA